MLLQIFGTVSLFVYKALGTRHENRCHSSIMCSFMEDCVLGKCETDLVVVLGGSFAFLVLLLCCICTIACCVNCGKCCICLCKKCSQKPHPAAPTESHVVIRFDQQGHSGSRTNDGNLPRFDQQGHSGSRTDNGDLPPPYDPNEFTYIRK